MDMHDIRSLKRPLLSKQVEKHIKDCIVSRIYKPFDKLPSERNLMNQFKVSRTTIREALITLQNSGLIVMKRGVSAGAYVCEINPNPITENFRDLIRFGKINFVHLMDARLYIEPEAARIAAILRTEKDIEMLKELSGKMERSHKTSNKEARLLNLRFHCEVAKVTKNPIIIFFSESVTQVFSVALIEMTKLSKAEILENSAEHRRILDSIVEKNQGEAFTRAKEHIMRIYHLYSRIMPNVSEEDMVNLVHHDNVITEKPMKQFTENGFLGKL